MDEQLKNDDKKVMLVEVPGEGQLKGITNIDKNGNAKVTRDDVLEGSLAKLFDVNTHDSALEAFFKKMMEQAQDPARTGISKAVSNIFIISKSALDKLLKVGLDRQLLEPYRALCTLCETSTRSRNSRIGTLARLSAVDKVSCSCFW